MSNWGAQNLVPNPSFEDYSECPDNLGQIERAIGWYGLTRSPYYYHECGTNGVGIPVSRFGGGYARSGQAYVSIAVWAKTISNGRRYLAIELTEPLVEGVKYRAKFYVSLLDSIWYATRNIGIHFSNTPHSQNVNELLNLTPQVSYSDTSFITDKLDWVEVSGSFTVQGGERYLAIGNFDSDSETDTVFVPGGGNGVLQPESFWHEANYFIDDVLVIPDSIYLSTPEVEKENLLSLYPNPATETVTIEIAKWQNREVEFYDAMGKLVAPPVLPQGEGKRQVDVSNLPRGVYVMVVKEDGTVVARKKLVLQ